MMSQKYIYPSLFQEEEPQEGGEHSSGRVVVQAFKVFAEKCRQHHDRNYGAMALKYDCSYLQIRNWVNRYEKMGSAGLEDRRGRRIGSKPSRTPEEELRDRIAELERKNKDLQMENDLLKKVRELERRDRFL